MAATSTRERSIRRRRRVLGAAGIALWTVALSPLVVVEADAQASPTARPAVVPGKARADAQAYKFAIGLTGSISGSGQVTLTRGAQTTTADDARAESVAQALDLGLVPTAFDYRSYPPDCPAVPPARFAPSTMPKSAFAQSSDPEASTSRPTEVRWPGATTLGDVAGVQDATAGPDLRSASSVSVGDVVGPLLAATGVTSESSTSVDAAGRRLARSAVSATSIDLAGVATISQPRFVAVSASDGSTTSSFTFDFVYFAGQYRTGADGMRALEDAKAFAEGLFAGLGVKIDLPVSSIVPRTNASPDETFSIESTLSPLRVRVSKIPLARDLLGPIFDTLQPQIEELKAQIRADRCADKSLLNLIGLTVEMLSGQGELGTSIGGVSAFTSDAWTAPFVPRSPTTAATTPPAAPPVTVLGETTNQGQPRSVATSSNPSSGPITPVADPVPTTSAPDAAPTTSAKPEVARISRPATGGGGPSVGTRGGVLTWVTLALMGGVLVIAAADRFVLVRRSTS